ILTVYDATDITGALAPGGAPTDVITTVPGQNARYSFTVTQGQQVSAQLTNWTATACDAVALSFLRPDGSSLRGYTNCSGDGSKVFLDNTGPLPAGTYTL